MKKINCKYYLAFAIFLLSGAFIARGQSAEENKPAKDWSYNSSDWCNTNVPIKYRLTTKQMSSILYLQSKYDEIIRPEIEKLRTLRRDIKNLNAESADNKSMDIQRLEEKLFELRLEARIEIRSILSPKQITYFDDFIFSNWWNYKS